MRKRKECPYHKIIYNGEICPECEREKEKYYDWSEV